MEHYSLYYTSFRFLLLPSGACRVVVNVEEIDAIKWEKDTTTINISNRILMPFRWFVPFHWPDPDQIRPDQWDCILRLLQMCQLAVVQGNSAS